MHSLSSRIDKNVVNELIAGHLQSDWIIIYSISWLETDSFFFLHGSFVLEYADLLSNQRNFFRHGSFVLPICPIKSVEYAWPQKTFTTRANFLSSKLFSFLSTCLFLIYLIKSL